MEVMNNFKNADEDIILKQIFNDTISIYTYEDTKTYQILFKNKYYEFIIDKDYPASFPISSVILPDKVVEKYKNKPMIYQLLYECIKKEELNLDVVDEFTSVIEYKDIDRIIEEQYQEYKLSHIKIKSVKEGMSGREIFLAEKRIN